MLTVLAENFDTCLSGTPADSHTTVMHLLSAAVPKFLAALASALVTAAITGCIRRLRRAPAADRPRGCAAGRETAKGTNVGLGALSDDTGTGGGQPQVEQHRRASKR